MENIRNAEFHIQTVLDRVKVKYIQKTYGIDSWSDADDFLEKMAYKCGRLLKVGLWLM